MHLPELISDLAIMLLTAGVVTVIFKKIKQPLVLGYIVAGFLIGPYMPLFFTVADSASISTWSEIGVIVLMFGLGLEFNLHKLAQVGGTAIITALTEVGGMLLIGFGVGQLLGWGIMDSVFLGGMLSMSSTTIIIKAFDELGVRNQGFAQLVFGTLVIEDIAGIFMMIILSTLSVSQSISGGALAMKLALLVLYLALWLILGIYLLPTLMNKATPLMNDETLLVSSHILSELSELCTSIGIIEQGRTVLQGSMDQIFARINSSNPLLISIFSQKEKALAILKSHPCVQTIAVQGDEIKLGFLGDRQDEALLLQQLIDADVMVSSFMREKGSLESLFMQITGHEEERAVLKHEMESGI